MLARVRGSLFAALCVFVGFSCAPGQAAAEVRLPSFISDHMVLQCDTELKIRGWADAGEEVTVTLGVPGVDESGAPTTKLWITNLATGSATADAQGNWLVKLPRQAASMAPRVMTVAGNKNTITLKDILIGEVWICSGQSNMAMDMLSIGIGKDDIAAAEIPGIRLLNITAKKMISDQPQADLLPSPLDKKKPVWQRSTPQTVGSFSAAGFYFGRELHQKLNVPVGLISAAWGGSPIERWIPWDVYHTDPTLATYPAQIKREADDLPRRLAAYEKAITQANAVTQDANVDPNGEPASTAQPATQATTRPATTAPAPVKLQKPQPVELLYGSMFNAMIAPLSDYTIRGVVWYHGSANEGDPKGYTLQFPAMIRGWRKAWGQGDFPFYFVQLANFMAPPTDANTPTTWAPIREAQRLTLDTPNTGMVVAIDLGEAKNIHPKNKLDVGKRLALWALSETYKQPNIVFSGPLYESMKIEGSTIRITFKHVAGGLKIKGDKLAGFAIAGGDGKYAWADAVIDGATVVVSSPSVPSPKSVRYAWANNPACNLYNSADLPASPFRAGETNELPAKKIAP